MTRVSRCTETRQGRRPGDTYIRRVRPYDELFQRSDEGELIATERTVLDRPGWTRTLRRVRTILIGRPISSEREEHERLTKLKALAIFSSDNISSSAYATEEMMRILVIAGVGAISLTMPLTVLICAVLAIVATSYWQTIRAYPNGASSYLVSSDNLGSTAGLVAGAALLIDYTLTVAVSVSAAVAAITSVVPELFPERVLIAVAIVFLLMLGNLRGVRESGTIFMAPTLSLHRPDPWHGRHRSGAPRDRHASRLRPTCGVADGRRRTAGADDLPDPARVQLGEPPR